MAGKDDLSRREFLKTAGAAGVGSLLAAREVLSGEVTSGPSTKPARPTVPKRPLGKTGVKVPCLAFGGAFDILSNQALLTQALRWGITYWDSAGTYARGKSELGIGKYFQDHPADRKRVFLISKGLAREPDDLTTRLNRSLTRLKTDHIDLYFVHAIRGPEELTRWGRDWKAWSEKTKKSGKIKLFGFSAHQNMAASLMAASKQGWIDVAFIAYSYRFMTDEGMKVALDACHKAGKGIVAMKAMALGPPPSVAARPDEPNRRLLEKFRQKGWSEPQAKFKAVWADERIATISTRMHKPAYLAENVAAALDRRKLSPADLALLKEHAELTRSGHCAGCGQICESAVAGAVPICDVMRYLMYYHAYGDRERARELFAELPTETRGRLARIDYSPAERLCPNGLTIGKLMEEASGVLA
jgi:predicted aldo/keto reductase-like oxidoreductase